MLAPLHRADVGAPLSDVEVPDIDTPNLRPYQHEAATFAREREGSLLALSMGCVSGDTIIWKCVRVVKGKPGKVCSVCGGPSTREYWRKTTIRSLWESSSRANPRILAYWPNGTLHKHTAAGIIERGKKEVVRLNLKSGRSLVLTPDHEVAVARHSNTLQFRAAGDLSAGNVVLEQATTRDEWGFVIDDRHVREGRVASVERGFQTEVYDLAMDDPHHNFVANGIIVANCGKTRTSLYAVREDHDQVGLIVAPKVTFPVWRREIKLVFGDDYPVRVVHGRTLLSPEEKLALRAPGINLLNPEILASRWSEWLGFLLDYVILDEAHYYTHSHAKRTSAAAAIANLARKRIALTGTPILRHVMDLYGIIQAIAPGSFGSWQRMAFWLELRKGAHGWDLSEPITADARARLESRLSEIMIVKRWEEVSDSVPPLQRELLQVDFDEGDREHYDRMANDVREALGDEVSLSNLVKASAAQLVQLLALRRFVGVSKIPRVVELVRSAGEPVVVWTWHRDVAQQTSLELRTHGFRISTVTGEDTEKKRQQAIWRFQHGETDVFVGTIAVGGVGIDLTRARITVMGELSWLPAEIAQAEARVFRTGQERPCITY